MDNLNALSKSAILTKLALDGYFIDLATLNTFISQWKIEAIYENELSIEFFDDDAYKTILSKLKEKYILKKKDEQKTEPTEGKQNEPQTACHKDYTNEIEHTKENEIKNPKKLNCEFNNEPEDNFRKKAKENNDEDIEYISDNILDEIDLNDEDETSKNQDCDSIMPKCMSALLPKGPITPNSDYKIVREESHFRYKSSNEKIQNSLGVIKETLKKEKTAISKPVDNTVELHKAQANVQIEKNPISNNNDSYGNDLMSLAKSLSSDSGAFSKEEPVNPQSLDEIFEQSYVEPFEDLEPYASNKNNDEADIDLKELSHYFDDENVLQEQETAYQTQNQTEDETNSSKNLEISIQDETKPAKFNQEENLQTALEEKTTDKEDIKEIIRQEVLRQTKNAVSNTASTADIKEIVKNEVSKQTQNVPAVQNTLNTPNAENGSKNTFNLDISQGTLDMIAKTIAKKIAIKLNSYYQLNSTKQNTKIQLYREKTIELKEKVQSIEEENKKLKMLLLESNKRLNSYKPAFLGIFNLYKFQKNTKKKKR